MSAVGEEESRLATLLDPEYVAGVSELSAERLRSMLTECEAEEAALSYARRLLQGKIDVLDAEMNARSEGGGGTPVLIERLPEILAPEKERHSRGRLPKTMIPEETPLIREVNQVLADPSLIHIDEMSDEELSSAIAELTSKEREVSSLRAQLHRQIGVVEDELTRRYSDGGASVEEVL